jgi:hypothetical protein
VPRHADLKEGAESADGSSASAGRPAAGASPVALRGCSHEATAARASANRFEDTMGEGEMHLASTDQGTCAGTTSHNPVYVAQAPMDSLQEGGLKRDTLADNGESHTSNGVAHGDNIRSATGSVSCSAHIEFTANGAASGALVAHGAHAGEHTAGKHTANSIHAIEDAMEGGHGEDTATASTFAMEGVAEHGYVVEAVAEGRDAAHGTDAANGVGEGAHAIDTAAHGGQNTANAVAGADATHSECYAFIDGALPACSALMMVLSCRQ